MTQNEFFTEFGALPSEAQNQVADFVAFLRQKYQSRRAAPTTSPKDLETESFIGMWRDRDVPESTDWVRQTRQSEWDES